MSAVAKRKYASKACIHCGEERGAEMLVAYHPTTPYSVRLHGAPTLGGLFRTHCSRGRRGMAVCLRRSTAKRADARGHIFQQSARLRARRFNA
jgi:hypothetical protein